MEPYQISLVIALAFAVAEVMTMTFIFLSFALAFVVISIFQYITGGYDINREIILFSVFSVLFTFFFRSLFRGKKDQSVMKTNDDVNLY